MKSRIIEQQPGPTQVKTTVSYNSDKDAELKAAASSLGGKFNNVTDAYNLIKANEDYNKYFGDVKKWDEELKGNNNCVDWAQFLAHIMDKLNAVAKLGYKYKYVRAYCEVSKIWLVYLEVIGDEFGSSTVDVDGAPAA
ncbi:hypothetical protein [Methanobacterium congolense]|uniref:Pseudomurein endo-isopeptidase Pei n=1 Tax=Methanobacterium congolense TaxID=118062 RepID=A0A1D3L2D4_9EURY|nr:hypothetical protein [Methanobacterium congolense]SCG85620.1 Pseudomurein endo-isopeptidase Pei [Methanobacterium congolense]